MSGLEVQSVLQKMVAMRVAGSGLGVGFGFQDLYTILDNMAGFGVGSCFRDLYTVLEELHANVMRAELLLDGRGSAAYSFFIADLRRVALSVDDALDKVSSSGAPPAQGLFQRSSFKISRETLHQLEEDHRDLQMLLRLFSTYVADLLPKQQQQENESDALPDGTSALPDKPAKLLPKQQPQEIESDALPNGTSALPDIPELIGRNQDKEHVLGVINDSDTTVVAIIGMAGVGKTALARHMYNAARGNGFTYRMWVDGTQDFSPERIFRMVMSSFSSELHDGEDSESSWWSVKQGLVNKKYLLVLDNVWNEDPLKWNQLLHLLSSKKVHRNKIIVTTRTPAAAGAIPSVKTHNLLPLSVEDSLKLLDNDNATGIRSFREVNERCSGLPKLVGFLKNSLGTINQVGINPVEKFDLLFKEELSHLYMAKASYNHLQPHLQRCFLYCSLFPPDRIFDAEDMIFLWVAEGLSQVSIREAQVDDGFFKLLDECFVATDKFGSRGQMMYKMQYILHNLARHKGGDLYKAIKIENCSSLSEHSTRYMSLLVDLTTKELPILLTEQKDLRTLILVRNQEMVVSCQKSVIREIPSDYCRYLIALRVLDLHATRIEKLPDTFHMLSNLRYLNLSETHIATLPESFEKFQYLIYLNIGQTYITAIPKSIDRMKSLRYLDISQTGVRELPESIGNLRMLQTLQLSHCEKLVKLPHSIAYLTRLQKLDLEGCHYLSEMPRDISKMKNLKELNILECSSLDQMPCGLSALTRIEALPRYIATGDHKHTILELQGLTSMKKLGMENLERLSMDDIEIFLKQKSKLENLSLSWNTCANIGNSGAERQHNYAHSNQANHNSVSEEQHGSLPPNQRSSGSHVEQELDGSQPTQGNNGSDVEQQTYSLEPTDVEQPLNDLEPNEELKTLDIISYGGRKLPPWLTSGMPNLVQIRLINLRCDKLPPLGQLPLLTTVEISGMQGIKHISNDLHGDNGDLRSVKNLTFSQMLDLESWPADNGAKCPNLVELSILQCPNFKKLSMKLQVKKLAVWMTPRELICNGLTGVHSSLKSMSISLCQELSSSECEALTELSDLEDLEISGCDELESLPLSLQNHSSLTRLSVIGCHKFNQLTDLSQYTVLKSLHISGCPMIPSNRFDRGGTCE